MSAGTAIANNQSVFKRFNPEQPFQYTFIDGAYARKFGNEQHIGRLAAFFAGLAIFISCLGLFGMASFMAEQRVKEIGVRKVLGTTVFNLWRLLSADFISLVMLSLLLAKPIAFYLMYNWLQHFDYRTGISAWIFIVTGFTTLVITLLTVSLQTIKAALTSPVKSLKSE